MRIARYRVHQVRPRYTLVRIETDTGLTGWGEATLEGFGPAVAGAVDQYMSLIAGEDPRRIEHCWQRMYRGGFYRGGPVLCSAISGIEHALWDILGKSLGVPVHVLLGGAVRDRIRMYAQAHGETPERLAAEVRRRLDEGLTAVKLVPCAATPAIAAPAEVERVAALVAAAREAAGPAVDLAVDAHGRLSPAMALQVAAAIEPYGPMFLEEPCLPGNTAAMASIARGTRVPIAAGERLFTRWGFRELLEARAIAVAQPDPAHAGGIAETRRIAAMAEAYDVALAPHCPLSPVALAACLQIDACTPNFLIQEYVDLGEQWLARPFVLDAGHLLIPSAPGLGIEIDEAKLAALEYDGRWTGPQWSHEDGTVAEW